jgi:type IV pilus assembly protein PilV
MKIKSNSGFTLIEVLVSVVILGVGLLGLAALQTTNLSNNQSAYFRSMATQFAYDISDRMRGNRVGVNAGNYNNGAAANNNCIANNCTAAQMAAADLFQWNTALQQLPAGVGIVCLDATPGDGTAVGLPGSAACSNTGNIYAVKIWWDDTRSGNPLQYQQFVMSFQP